MRASRSTGWRRRTTVAAVAALGLLANACSSDLDDTATGSTDSGAAGSGEAAAVAVSLTDQGCAPLELSAVAGTVVFAITNATDDQAEFEVLSPAPEILSEEFVDAGASRTVEVVLPAGSYEIICGAPSDPRAKLTVGASTDGSDGATDSTAAIVDAEALAAATAEYQSFVAGQVAALQAGTTAFTDAVRAGDTEAAKALYAEVRIPWEQIEPVAELFPESDGLIDARADDYELGEADPAFSGFHALEYGLWAQGTIGGAEVDLVALADQLDADIADLAEQITALAIQPQVMTNGAAALIEEAAQTKVTGEEERYSRTDLVTFAANVDGARVVFDLVETLLSPVDADLVASITAAFDEVGALLEPYRDGQGFVAYDEVTDADRAKFKTAMAALSELLSQVTGSLGLTIAA